jgi:hypothetical protein
LPLDCSTGTKSAVFNASQVDPTRCDEEISGCGLIEPPENVDVDVQAAYNSCKWSFQVTVEADVPCGPCPTKYINIVNGNEPDLTEQNYCPLVENFTTGSGCFQYIFKRFSNTECITEHEDEHFKILKEKLAEQRLIFLGRPSMNDMPIDCSDPDTTTCHAAVIARIAAIDDDAKDAYRDAHLAMLAEGDERPFQVARPCFTKIANLICDHASNQGWESCEYCP